MNIADLVTDWDGFEKLVATLHETGEVTVEHNVVLPGRSGAPRQIDVLIRHKQGLYEHLVVAECKYWNSPVERLHVDALATTTIMMTTANSSLHGLLSLNNAAGTAGSMRVLEIVLPKSDPALKPMAKSMSCS
jgi:Nuclease-related domain